METAKKPLDGDARMKFTLTKNATAARNTESRSLRDEIQRLRMENEMLKTELNSDDLTGLYNARYLRTRLEECVGELQTQGRRPALLFIDVDHFKEVNERHGHLAAGKVLEQIGRLLARVVRKGDVAFRYGGDEFVVLVSGGQAGAFQVGERIRASVQSSSFAVRGLRGQDEVKVTVSVGTCVMKPGDTVVSVLENADRAMFEAKRNSRNTLVAA